MNRRGLLDGDDQQKKFGFIWAAGPKGEPASKRLTLF